MEVEDSIIAINKFILGEGKDGVYSDITIEIKKSIVSKISRGVAIELTDEKILKAIEKEFVKNWINIYQKDGICFEVVILNVGFDCSRRQYSTENSINTLMHDALPKIGINPPQIFKV